LTNKLSTFKDLLKATIENAGRIPFYKAFWNQKEWGNIQNPEGLRTLPIMTRYEAKKYFNEFVYTTPPALVSHSSGTSGEITVRCRSQEELNSIWKLYDLPELDRNKKKPLCLSINCANHGQNIPLPSKGICLQAVGFDRQVIEHVSQQLLMNYDFPGHSTKIEEISCTPAFLKLLTIGLQSKNQFIPELGVKRLILFGEYLSSRTISYLESIWQASILNRYSCSEAIGGARYCTTCGTFNFDELSYVEIVNFKNERIDYGIGRLTITELYPFSILQPLIRYQPGDIFLARKSCSGAIGYQFLGRESDCVFDINGELILSSTQIADFLDNCPHISRSPSFHGVSLEAHELSISAPLARVEVFENTIQISAKFNEGADAKIAALALDIRLRLKESLGAHKGHMSIKAIHDDTINEGWTA